MSEISITTTFDSSGLSRIVKGQTTAQDMVIKHLAAAAQKVGILGLQFIGELTPVLTGALLSSEQFSIDNVQTDLLQLTWFSQIDYSTFQEEGTSRGITGKHMFGRGIENNLDALLAPFAQAAQDLATELQN